MKAIKQTGNNLLAALDPMIVLTIDSYFQMLLFTEPELFDRHRKRKHVNIHIDYFTICSPNYFCFTYKNGSKE